LGTWNTKKSLDETQNRVANTFELNGFFSRRKEPIAKDHILREKWEKGREEKGERRVKPRVLIPKGF
jgi:hypothetical protein